MSTAFALAWSAMSGEVHATATQKGFWDAANCDAERDRDARAIALMHSELSEALEALRHGNPASEKIPAFTHAEEELADTIIRIMDFAQARGLNVAGAVVAKAEYNKGRPYMHGKKF